MGMNGWTNVNDSLPTKSGRYQVILVSNDTYHVTMRKFYADKLHWTGKRIGIWERGTGGIAYWKPMDKMPDHLKPNKNVLGYGGMM